jgi:anti-sigma B factor antagonist
MNIRENKSGKVNIVSIQGSIDALTAEQITDRLNEVIARGEVHLVLDLGQVDFMSSAGLRMILGALKKTRQKGGDLYIAATQTGVARLLKMSGFVTISCTFDSVEEAVKGFDD